MRSIISLIAARFPLSAIRSKPTTTASAHVAFLGSLRDLRTFSPNALALKRASLYSINRSVYGRLRLIPRGFRISPGLMGSLRFARLLAFFPRGIFRYHESLPETILLLSSRVKFQPGPLAMR